MFDLGIQELIVIFIVALIVFGPKRLPELGRTLGKFVLEARKALQDVKTQIDSGSDAAKNPVLEKTEDALALKTEIDKGKDGKVKG